MQEMEARTSDLQKSTAAELALQQELATAKEASREREAQGLREQLEVSQANERKLKQQSSQQMMRSDVRHCCKNVLALMCQVASQSSWLFECSVSVHYVEGSVAVEDRLHMQAERQQIQKEVGTLKAQLQGTESKLAQALRDLSQSEEELSQVQAEATKTAASAATEADALQQKISELQARQERERREV